MNNSYQPVKEATLHRSEVTGVQTCALPILIQRRKEKHNPDGPGDCVKKCLWNGKNFDIMGTGTPEPGERQEDKCT